MDNDHIKLLQKLVSFNTITPSCIDAVRFCEELLKKWGFTTRIHQSGNVPNLMAYLNRGSKTLCVAGHLDVVDPGDGWTYNPFELVEHDGKLYGRGTNDMKGGLSSAIIAIRDFIKQPSDLSIMILLTGDEEVMTDNGMKSLMNYVTQYHNDFIIGVIPESCSPKNSGEYIKIGCRGSMNINLTSVGHQGHVACTKNNHLHKFVDTVNNLVNFHIDDGNNEFEPSTLQLTSIDVGNSVRNIVPNKITAEFNIRFNNVRSPNWIKQAICNLIPNTITANIETLSEPFIGCSCEWQRKTQTIVETSLNKTVDVGTAGGNSDAQTLHKYMNVVEIGSPLSQAHTANEFITRSDMDKLRKLYYDIFIGISILIKDRNCC